MPLGLFFDFMDGKVARWRKKSSLMGQELDSLADLVRTYHNNYFPAILIDIRRSHSVSPPLFQHSLLDFVPQLITSSSHSSSFAV